MASKTIDLSKYRDLDLDSITMRSLCGEDLIEAAARCIPTDGAPLDGNIFGLQLRQQVIAQSIESYTRRDSKTAKSCPLGSLESTKWSLRTREFVGEMYDYINNAEKDERDSFKKALAGGASPVATSPAP